MLRVVILHKRIGIRYRSRVAAATFDCFLLLPIAPSCSQRLLLPCLNARETRRHTNSQRLPPSSASHNASNFTPRPCTPQTNKPPSEDLPREAVVVSRVPVVPPRVRVAHHLHAAHGMPRLRCARVRVWGWELGLGLGVGS